MNQSLIRSIEDMTRRVWPPAEIDRVGGWELRATGGYTRRANSVNPYPPDPADIRGSVDDIEAWYGRRGLPAVFRFTPVSDAPALQPVLERRGYAADRGTLVMTAPADEAPVGEATVGDTEQASVEISMAPTTEWIAAKDAWSPLPPAHRAARTDLLARITVPVGYGLVRRRGFAVAAGHAAVDGDMVALFGLVVDPSHRRQGHATRLTVGLMAWGASRGATVAWLQVHAPSNRTAVDLYQRVGFTRLYEYWYLERVRQPG